MRERRRSVSLPVDEVAQEEGRVLAPLRVAQVGEPASRRAKGMRPFRASVPSSLHALGSSTTLAPRRPRLVLRRVQDARGSSPWAAAVHHVTPALERRQRLRALEIELRVRSAPSRGPPGKASSVGRDQGFLRDVPRRDHRGRVVLEPAIRVGDLLAVHVVDDVALGRHRVDGLRRDRGRRRDGRGRRRPPSAVGGGAGESTGAGSSPRAIPGSERPTATIVDRRSDFTPRE